MPILPNQEVEFMLYLLWQNNKQKNFIYVADVSNILNCPEVLNSKLTKYEEVWKSRKDIIKSMSSWPWCLLTL